MWGGFAAPIVLESGTKMRFFTLDDIFQSRTSSNAEVLARLRQKEGILELTNMKVRVDWL